MTRDISLGQTSGVPKCVLIVLCEGKHDYEFISEIFMTLFPNVRVKEHFPDDKDILIRHAYDRKLSYVPIIVEGGKDVLDGNVKVFISKLRSISGSFIRVLILRDSDNIDVSKEFSKLERNIRDFLRNRDRFPKYEPQMACEQRINVSSFTLYTCTLKYRDGEVYLQFIFVVPSLEDFLSRYGHINNDEEGLRGAIKDALNKHGNDISTIFKNAVDPCITQ